MSETRSTQSDNQELGFLAGGGELGELMRSLDWERTPLGPPQTWPQSLRTAVRIMLTSRQPIWIGWGRELAFLYNDPYKSIIGGKHPWALGRPTREVWAEIWHDIGPMLDTAMGGVEGTYVEEQLLVMERSGYPEETYYTFSYSPIPDDDGSAGGIICANTDDTQRVIGERRLALLRELAASTAEARTWQEACERSLDALGTDRHDIPFALLYLAEPDSECLALVGTSGIEPGHPAAPEDWTGNGAAVWPLGDVLRKHDTVLLADIGPLFGAALPTGAWSQPPRQAALIPILPTGETGRAGVLVAALNPLRLFDDEYQGFLGLAAKQIAGAIANAQAYEEERRRAEQLAELDRAKTAFFSNVSHEFRTPLTLMMGPIEDILEKPQHELSADSRRLIDVAHRNGLRLLKLVNSLLDFARIEAGRMAVTYEPVDLAALTAELASNFRSATEKAGLDLVVDCAPLPEPVHVDRDMWEKIVLNLLSNAFKFTFDGSITVKLAAGDGAAVLTVRDTGTGIPASELPRLFERFHRIEGARGRSYEGSGIGLALVHELVQLHGGSVRAESEEGRGTAFFVAVPFGTAHLQRDRIAAEPARAPTAVKAFTYVEEALRWLPGSAASTAIAETGLADAAADAPAPPGAERAYVVLADDNADMRDYVHRLLGERHQVHTVADGEAALAAIREQRPDLVLTDVMMPKLDGFGLLRAIRADADLADLPVIMLSARAGEEASIEGMTAGADDYLVKPFSARELIARVDAILALSRLRREAAARLRESEARFRNMADHAPVMMWITDADGYCLYLNRSWYEFTGQSPEEAEGFGWLDATHPDDKQAAADAFLAANAARTAFRLEYRLRRADGVYRWAIDTASPRFGDQGEFLGYIGSVIDITERKEVEEAQRRLNQMLVEKVEAAVAERKNAEEQLRQAQKMEAIGHLTGGVAHDFNNLLQIVLGNIESLQRHLPPDTADRVRRSAENAMTGAKRAATLTQRLLAFSRRQPLDPTPVNLNRLVAGMSDMLGRTLGENVEIQTVLAGGLWQVEADANQLESALLNLAVNARDAMPEGGKLTIETANAYLDEAYAATMAEVKPGQYAVLAVSDTGSGMPKEVLERAFEPFFTTKPTGHGTGLGLSQVYGFVKQSGGHVKAYSEPGLGTTIKIYLPRLAGAEAQEDAAEATVPDGARDETILVVEDEEAVRQFTAEILRELGYRVVEAQDGPAALRQLERYPSLDLLFTDVGLPGMTGRELADEAKKRRPGLKVLFTTGYARNAIVHHGRLDPGVQMIGKPFTYADLAAKVRTVIDSAG